MALSYNNLNIDIPCLEWIGLRIDDLNRFYLKNQDNYLIALNKHDIQIANSLIKKFEALQEYDLIEQVCSFSYNELIKSNLFNLNKIIFS